MLLYIHGFGGRANGSTTRLLSKHLEQEVRFVGYDVRFSDQAIETIIKAYEKLEGEIASTAGEPIDGDSYIILMGSSLGGFYATIAASILKCSLVLFNPALSPDITLKKHIGKKVNVPGGSVPFKAIHVANYEKLSRNMDQYLENS